MFSLFFSHAHSWWAHPHALIGRIAENSLKKDQISQLDIAVSQNGLHFQSFLHCCRWQDDIKGVSHFDSMGSWHFNNDPILFDGAVSNLIPTYSLSNATSDMWKALSDPTTTDTWAFSFALASFAHFMGDIHTPHHNCDMFSKEFPNGDVGGNKFNLNCPWGSICSSLHALWDGAELKFQNSECLEPIYHKEFIENVSKLMSEIPQSEIPDVGDFAPFVWENESNSAAIQYGYTIEQYAFPSDEYLATAQNVSSYRIAAAGYRLGELLKQMFKIHKTLPGVPKPKRFTATIVLWILDAICVIITLTFLIIAHMRVSGQCLPSSFSSIQ